MNKPLLTTKAKAKKQAIAFPQSAVSVGQKVQIKWLDSGKPVLEGLETGKVELSLSHDDQVCLCVAGYGSQGCDIAPVIHRLRSDWMALLSAAREPLMQQLLANGSDSVDRAGTRIWAAVEALRKATNLEDIDLVIDRQQVDSVLFRGTNSSLHILTFPVKLTRGSERIVAVVVAQETAIGIQALPEAYDIYEMKMRSENQKLFVTRWPVSYQDMANLSQSVYFSKFFTWMGKVRDLAIVPIREPLGKHLATGEWGMVTNYAQTQILGEAGLNDAIEVRFWVAKVSGRANSTVDFHYDWRKVLPDGSIERIALSELRMTWVQIPKQGTPQPKPLPDFLEKFINQLYEPTYTQESLSESLKDVDLGEVLYQTPTVPTNGPLLQEQSFETSLEDTDAIGNINFANYYVLQGRIRDRFFHNLVPDCYRRTGNQGELRCLHSRVEHLREAMPFEQIHVTMSLRAAYKHGLSLAFEYFRITPSGEKQKLAIGEHDAVWFTRGEDGKSLPTLLPKAVLSVLLQKVT